MCNRDPDNGRPACRAVTTVTTFLKKAVVTLPPLHWKPTSCTYERLPGHLIHRTQIEKRREQHQGSMRRVKPASMALLAIFSNLCTAHTSLPVEESVVLAANGYALEDRDPKFATKIQRGKNLSDAFDVQELYEAYQAIQTDYMNKTHSAQDWTVLNANDGVEVSMLEHEGDTACPYIRMRATFPVPIQEVWDFLRVPNWEESMPKMDPFYEGVTIYGNYSNPDANMLLCRKRTKRILAFGKRDLVFIAATKNQPLQDGTWVSGTVSVETAKIPRQPGYTRAFQDSIAFYKPTDQNHTDLTMICRIDLNDSAGDGGWIPMWLYVRTIGYTGVQSFLRMRRALLEAKNRPNDRLSF